LLADSTTTHSCGQANINF